MVLHLLQHLQKNDNNILKLLACENNELFLRYFKENLKELIQKQSQIFENKKHCELPNDYWINHVAATFVETVKWWIDNGMQEDPETLSRYFVAVL